MNCFKMHLTYKLIAVLSILFSTLAIIIAFQNQAQGYELSIYESTPLVVWLSLILSIIGALYIIIHSITVTKYISSNFWIIGVFILLFNRLTLLYIPYIRGYFSWRGDNITHIGFLIDIINSGHVLDINFYPIVHILLFIFYIITNININLVINYSTSFFSAFYVISIYLLAKTILHTKNEWILAVTSAAPVFFAFNVLLVPNGWSQLYLPFLVYLYFKSFEIHNSLEYTFLYVILLIMYPFFHPLSSLYIILVLIIISIFNLLIYIILINKDKDKKLTLSKKGKRRIPLTAIVIESTILIPWILSFQRFNYNLKFFYHSILSGTSQNALEGMQGQLDKVNVHGIDFISLFIKQEGANFIFIILFVISLFVLGKKKHYLHNNQNLIIISFITIFTGFIYTSYLFGIVPGLQAIAAERIKSYIILFTPISAGYLFFYLFNKEITVKKIKIFPILCILIIFIASSLSICSLYYSPIVNRPGLGIVQQDMEGADWHINHQNNDMLTAGMLSSIKRLSDGTIGVEKTKQIYSKSVTYYVPDHFNYTEKNNKLGEYYLEDTYMMVTKMDTIVYDSVWSSIGRFKSHDFDRLLDDTSVEKIYSNGGTNFYFINGMN